MIRERLHVDNVQKIKSLLIPNITFYLLSNTVEFLTCTISFFSGGLLKKHFLGLRSTGNTVAQFLFTQEMVITVTIVVIVIILLFLTMFTMISFTFVR